MMIEKTILDYLNDQLTQSVMMEIPKGEQLSSEYVLLEKTGSGRYNFIDSVTIAIQSYADTLYHAAQLNETVKAAMDQITATVPQISKVSLNSDYNFTDTEKKNYRYQAVYDIVYHS